MAKEGSRAAPKNIRTPLAAYGMDSPVQPKLSVTRLWARRLMVRVDELSMPSGLLLGAGIAGVCGYGFLRTGPQWGLGGAVLLLGTACALALTGDAVAGPLPEPEPIPAPAPQPATTATMASPAPAMPKPINEPLEVVELPGGEFWMGEAWNRHRVRLSGFAMAKYPVTQKQYQEVMGENPSYFRKKQPTEEGWEDLPVETVSWFDAVKFCNKLSDRVGRKRCYRIVEPNQPAEAGNAEPTAAAPEVEWDQTADGYRLPTEAEWEYACRAGTVTAYSFGDNEAQLGEYAWFGGNSEGRTHELGTKKANSWGLHDLHGNVWEWCWDWYEEYPARDDRSVSLICPIGPPSGDRRVLRGGSFGGEPRVLRSASRDGVQPEVPNRNLGFRCVRGSGL